MTYAGNPAADMATWLAGRPEITSSILSADAQTAEDRLVARAMDRRDEALMGELDDRHAQDVADDWTEREAG